MVAQFEVAASGSIIFESRIAGMVCREIGIGPGTSSSQLVKSQKCNIRSVRLQMFTVSRNGERAGFPLEAEQEFYSGKDFLDRSAFRKQNVDVVAYVVQKRNAP
jgi:hypothetical protein